ncbi:dolichol kinase [Halapricum sp. CBA1109]|uniref:dolichol kinase n=1 Tax=Halapricum sp. CBA1109 TaxID=2668068 RepID=UPI00351AFA7A
MRELITGTESEVARRVVHASGTAVPLAYVLFPETITWPVVQGALILFLVVALGLEAVRLLGGLEWWIYDHLTRSYEQDNLAGYALYFISLTAVALVFAPDIAVPAMLMLTLGDPISGLLGSGELRTVKRLRVLVTMFSVCAVIAYPFVGVLPAVLGGIGAMLADGVKPVVRTYVIDDNLTIPPVAAAAMAVGVAVL